MLSDGRQFRRTASLGAGGDDDDRSAGTEWRQATEAAEVKQGALMCALYLQLSR